MAKLRDAVARFPEIACLLLALALLMKAWVPAGYMPLAADGRLQLVPCSGSGPMAMPAGTMAMDHPGHADHADHAGQSGHAHHVMGAMAMPAMAHAAPATHDGGHGDRAVQHPDLPCTFSGLSAPAVAAPPPLVLAAAIALLFAVALHWPQARPLRRAAYLQPPAQAPPAIC